jgi:hypothetical protein
MHLYSLYSLFSICRTSVYYFIKINGIYDIVCAIQLLLRKKEIKEDKTSLLYCIQYPHLVMLKEDIDHVAVRYFAYWILTYGLIRLIDPLGSTMIRISYGIEALCIAHETYITRRMDITNGSFVI